jgi:hypothetical protein
MAGVQDPPLHLVKQTGPWGVYKDHLHDKAGLIL